MNPISLSSKRPTETVTLGVDFSAIPMAGNESISEVDLNVRVGAGEDPGAGDILSGDPSIDDKTALFKVTGGVNGVDYLIDVKITTNLGQILEETVRLPVRGV